MVPEQHVEAAVVAPDVMAEPAGVTALEAVTDEVVPVALPSADVTEKAAAADETSLVAAVDVTAVAVPVLLPDQDLVSAS
jgi:hypothetical protein